jgi:hypothetical protein
MKIILSLYGRHREITHPQALQNLKNYRVELNDYYTFSSIYLYAILVKARLLNSLIFICLQLNKLSFLKIIIVISDHQLIKLLIKRSESSKKIISNFVINFFYNDWREIEAYKSLFSICYVVGGNNCIIANNDFQYVPIFPILKNEKIVYNNKKNLVFYSGNVFYSKNEAVTTLENINVSNAGKYILNNILDHGCFDDLSDKKKYFLSMIMSLKNEREILWLWSIYVNVTRTLFFHRLKKSSLKDKIFTVGSRLKNDFKFNGIEDNYNQSLIDKKISQVKVNLDLGSQLLESAFYARSNRIFELSPASIVQYMKVDQKSLFTDKYDQYSFKLFSEFENIIKKRFNEGNDDFQKRELEIRKNIISIREDSVQKYDI